MHPEDIVELFEKIDEGTLSISMIQATHYHGKVTLK